LVLWISLLLDDTVYSYSSSVTTLSKKYR